ncbi:MAG: hypothetical protein A2W91_05960 [Bacteroidetes bacterium GWF2_38_335]|nr:MAG: hypothetical protein A2W91_05960 [Bacteroidetes bacterium GWF2_38_335]OFY81619.1 MAG: hypothetical protein A2281_11755 [Bacteroidetes bacterium RIFOXYA12_FULL_38_20]HBS88971.1 PAS domain-containing sensor histidine kinase [Bacteroidales bacterium]
MIRLSIRKKLYFGFGFLTVMIVLLWVTGSYFISNLSDRSEAMLHENYQSVESAEYLVKTIDEIENLQMEIIFYDRSTENIDSIEKEKQRFEEHLKDVNNNITESGENNLVESLNQSYGLFVKMLDKSLNDTTNARVFFFETLLPQYKKVRNDIIKVSDKNRNAIIYKNDSLNRTASRAFLLLSLIGAACFFIGAYFSLIYPKSIIRPLKQLTAGIREIANRNYEQKLDFKSRDELEELAGAFNSMAGKLNEYEHSNLSQLLFEKKRTETIINNMNDAIIGLNENFDIIFSNLLACKLIGVSSKEITGKKVSEVIGLNRLLRDIFSDFSDNMYIEKPEFSSIKIVSENKPAYYSKEVFQVLLSGEGSNITPAGYVIILKNITRFLEQDEAKTDFIAAISHQLKTPIASLKLNLKLLSDSRIGNLNSEQSELIETLKGETGKMLNITSELLEISQIETGNFRFDLKPVNPVQVVDYIRESSEKQAAENNIFIEYILPETLPPFFGDNEKTAWVLLNLVNNAIQYSDKGSKVRIELKANNKFVEFCVEDFGKGISAEYLPRIFDKYFRVPGSVSKGTGLGLYISKDIITKQNGEIWAESSPGAGSRFCFRLPLSKKII